MYRFKNSKSKLTFLLFPAVFFSIYLVLPAMPKTLAYKYYTQTRFKVYNTVANKLFQKQIPISYVSTKQLQQKIANLQPWAVQQINSDFSNYADASVTNVVNTYNAIPANKFVVMFTIKDGKVQVTKHHLNMNGACDRGLEIYTNIFAYIAKQGYVRDVTFLLRLSDFFGEMPEIANTDFAPILTTSKDLNSNIDKKLILVPDYMSLEDIPKFAPRILNANKNFPWHKKEHKVLWRGGEADVSGFRHRLVAFNEEHPSSIVDAKFVVSSAEYLPPEAQVKAKFLLNIDGHTAAWTRPIWQLLSNSVFVKQNSDLTQWYYAALVPNMHYIPVTSSPELLEISLDKYSDEQLQHIALEGSAFAKDNLMINDMVAYIVHVLKKYEQMQASCN